MWGLGHDAASPVERDWECLNMESSRLLCDDGHSAICRAGAGKSQDSRGVDGWTATGQETGSHVRQEVRECSWN